MTALRSVDDDSLARDMADLGAAERDAATLLANASTETKNAALSAAAGRIRAHRDAIKAANADDVTEAKSQGISGAMLDRLVLDDSRIAAMAKGIER